jgi:hypothetical protein
MLLIMDYGYSRVNSFIGDIRDACFISAERLSFTGPVELIKTGLDEA